MGYTHYWTIKATKGEIKALEIKYQRAIKTCNKVIQAYQKVFRVLDSKHPNRLSGYSAFTSGYGGIKFNGTQDLAHEDFIFRHHFKENLGFNFCKTNNKPYDSVVTACLIIMQHYLGNAIEVSSDGSLVDFGQGMLLVKAYTKLSPKYPAGVKSELRSVPPIPSNMMVIKNGRIYT